MHARSLAKRKQTPAPGCLYQLSNVNKNSKNKIKNFHDIETCIISCMKRVTSPGSMHDTGCLALLHWDGMGREEGGGFRMGNTCISVPHVYPHVYPPHVADSF